MRALRACLRATVCLVGIVPTLAFGQCPGDTDRSRSITSSQSSPTQVRTWARASLSHLRPHAACSGILSAKAELWLESTWTGCEAEATSSEPTAVDSPAGHTVIAQRMCTEYWCSTAYRTRGRYSFNDRLMSEDWSNNAEAGECDPPPPHGGTQDPCNCETCGCSPLVVDLGNDGFQFSSPDDGAIVALGGRFDMYWVGWPLQPDDAWLVLDRNENERIDDATELFGTATPLATGTLARHGFQALAEFDANGDGVVSVADPKFSQLRLWRDANRDGVATPREMTSLEDAGLVELSTAFQSARARDQWGNRFTLRSTARFNSPPFVREVVDVYPAARLIQ